MLYKNIYVFGHLNRLSRTALIRIVWSYTTNFREAKLADMWALVHSMNSSHHTNAGAAAMPALMVPFPKLELCANEHLSD